MKTLSNIKKDMDFNRDLSSLIETLKTIAVAQYRIQEKNIRIFREFLSVTEHFFDFVDTRRLDHPFLNDRHKLQAVVAITSDSGLLGGLNMHVINYALSELDKSPGKLIVLGERGKAYLRDTSISFVSFGGIKDEERFQQAMQLRDYVAGKVLEGVFGSLKVVFPMPVSFAVQRVEAVSFLPYVSTLRKPSAVRSPSSIIFESTPADIIEYLIYLWIGQKFYEIFGLSRLSEFAARFIHLEGSHQRLKEMDIKIRQEYFRVRHESIDRNMRELFAGRLLYASH